MKKVNVFILMLLLLSSCVREYTIKSNGERNGETYSETELIDLSKKGELRECDSIKCTTKDIKWHPITIIKDIDKRSLIPCSNNIQSTQKPVANVYIENSGSMDGYVKGVTDFEAAVYSFLCDVKNSGITEGLNLNYINSEVLKMPDDVSDFIEKLEPATFKAKGGKRGTTDISDLFKTILSENDENSIAILVSDCIFSPGKGRNASQYLTNQKIGIQDIFSNVPKKIFENYATIIFRLESKFDGWYYDPQDTPTKINEVRPYYIVVMGKMEHLKNLQNKVPISKMEGGGVKHSYALFPTINEVPYQIVIGSGKFTLDKKSPKNSIGDLQKDTRTGKISFDIQIDYSDLLLDEEYVSNINNYELSDPNYSIEKITKKSNNKFQMTVVAQHVAKNVNLKIELKNKIPQWVDNYTDEDGFHVKNALEKTYGLKYLIGGMYKAFTKDDDNYCEFKFSIN